MFGTLFNLNLSQQEPRIKEDSVEQHGPNSKLEQRQNVYYFPHSWKQKVAECSCYHENLVWHFPRNLPTLVTASEVEQWLHYSYYA